MPASKLARIAVDSGHQRRGYGGLLLLDAMQRTVAIAENAGLIGLFVDAKDEPAAVYYRKYGFVALKSNPLQLFLAMGTIRRTFS
jgi:ribosomal protein S18 acetylase RimI-like enzyme